MRGQPGLNTQPHARLPSSFLGMVYLTNKCSFDSQATWVIGVLGLCTTRHWQISRQLVQELNVTKFTQYIVFRKVEQNQATLFMGLPSMNGLEIVKRNISCSELRLIFSCRFGCLGSGLTRHRRFTNQHDLNILLLLSANMTIK